MALQLETSLRSKLADVSGVRIPVRLGAPSIDRDFAAFVDDPSSGEDAELVATDGDSFVSRSVPPLNTSSFSLFLDGIETTEVAFHWMQYTGRLAYIAAGVFRREGSDFQLAAVEERSELLLLVPENEELIARLNTGPCIVVPVPLANHPTPQEFDQTSRKLINQRRSSLEAGLVRTAAKEWMLVDGNLGDILQPGDPEMPRVGVVKSHLKQYFQSPERIQTILNLGAGERTTLFHRKASRNQSEAYSCYLRLHQGEESSIFHGLVRIEIPPTVNYATRIDDIAGWILAERYPIAFPERRADRMVYPIALVEKCLRANQPSLTQYLI